MNKISLVKVIIITFIYQLAFSLCKIYKILTADPEFWGCAIFGPKMVHLPKQKLFWKIINIILIYLLAPFIVQIFLKKFFQQIQSY